jgi:hypothetical protein
MAPQSNAAEPSAARAGRAMGAMFFSGFGAAWLVLWLQRAFGLNALPLGLIVAGTLALFGFAYRQYQQNKSAKDAEAGSPESKQAARIFNIVNVTQWVAILIVGNVLANIGLGQWVLAAAILTIGLHFFPLAKAFQNPGLNMTGAALVVLALAYPAMTPGGAGNPIGCLGAGLILWLSAIRSLV